jgi:hypothetical protein
LDTPEENHKEDAEFHQRKGPEFHRAKCDRSEKKKKNQNKFDKIIKHSQSVIES